MADIKVIYKNTDGLDNEHNEAADSVKFLSFKTATKELTDTKLGHLIDGADAQDEHIHDVRYFRQNQFINASTGAADAGKPVITGAQGKLSQTFIDVPALNASLDHGMLIASSLLDDDHPQYLRTDGTRDVTGLMKYSTLVNVNDDRAITTKKYVDDAINTANLGQEWYDSVVTRTITPPPTPPTGARYLIDGSLGTPTGVWSGHANQVATWNGTTYTYQTPTNGTFVSVDDEPTKLYSFNGTWQGKSFEVTTASTGVTKIGTDLQLDPNSAGLGLGFTAGVYNVNVDAVGIEINADTLRIKDLGVKAPKIDFGTGAGQVSGVNIPLADAGAYFATDNVEAALQFLGAEALSQGAYYIAGTGGITKGQLVYISSNNTVLPFSTITNNNYNIGLAATTVAAGGSVKVLGNDNVITGVLTGATAGTRYYWNGTGFQTAIPASLNANVWAVGIAKNATDLSVEVVHVKKNSAV